MTKERPRNDLWKILDSKGTPRYELAFRPDYKQVPGRDSLAPIHDAFFQELWGIMYREGQSLLKDPERIKKSTKQKVDGDGRTSPVTDADIKIGKDLTNMLHHYTRLPVVSEEASLEENTAAIRSKGYVWVIDPIDGTLSYLEGRKEYSVNVALLSPPDATGNRKPVFGAVYVPAKNELYFTDAKNRVVQTELKAADSSFGARIGEPSYFHPRKGFWGNGIKVANGHTDAEKGNLDILHGSKRRAKPDTHTGAYRSLMVATGKKHAAIFMPDNGIWDTAATDALLRCAGVDMLPIDPQTKKIIGDGMYYGDDPAKYKNGQLFHGHAYISLHPNIRKQLKIASEVELDVGAAKGGRA